MGKHNNLASEMKDRLDTVSCSMCLAKWTQVTVLLQNGQTHSCHHPKRHSIPLNEIRSNPSALHNTQYKKLQRKKMLEGERPAECDYCWTVEDSSDNLMSDRHYKSSSDWSAPFFDEIVNGKWDNNYNPKYLEVSFSHACNFKCSYCSPDVSSKWMEEINKYGPYPTSTKFNNLDYIKQEGGMPIPLKEHNPYVDAFDKWLPEIYDGLKVYRITGGEPLMHKKTFESMEWIADNPNMDLEFCINTNLGAEEKVIDKFIEHCKMVENKVKKFRVFTSCDTSGNHAEYIRHGLKYDYFVSNLHRILKEVPTLITTIMCTFNALSIPKFIPLLAEVNEIKTKYYHEKRHVPTMINMPFLRHPAHQSVKILTPDWLDPMYEIKKFMEENKNSGRDYYGFYDFEISGIDNLIEWMKVEEPELSLITNRRNFALFVDEHDRRRGTNFLKTFPEMEEFYELCKRYV